MAGRAFTIATKVLLRCFTVLDKISRWRPNQCDHQCKVFERIVIAIIIENVPE
jgi:hypothetical protein